MKRIILVVSIMVLLAGCAQMKHGKTEYVRLGDQSLTGVDIEIITGKAEIIADPDNPDQMIYKLSGSGDGSENAVGTYTRLTFDSQKSKGELNIDTLAATISQAVIAALNAGE